MAELNIIGPNANASNSTHRRPNITISQKKTGPAVYTGYQPTPKLNQIGQKTESTQDTGTIQNNSFEAERLHEVWIEYARHIKKNLPHLGQILENQAPTITLGTQLTFYVETSFYKDYMDKNVLQHLQSTLRRELKNDNIKLQFCVSALGKRPIIDYEKTPLERLSEMRSRNNLIEKLITELHLEAPN